VLQQAAREPLIITALRQSVFAQFRGLEIAKCPFVFWASFSKSKVHRVKLKYEGAKG
jgi:hypothetical protein